MSLTACSGTAGSAPESQGSSQTETESSAAQPQAAHYPVTVSNYNYAKEPVDITFERCPEKVLVLNQNNIETMLALGLGDKIVAAAGLDHEVKAEYQADFETQLSDGFYRFPGIGADAGAGYDPGVVVYLWREAAGRH